jgi:hypothetical protein
MDHKVFLVSAEVNYYSRLVLLRMLVVKSIEVDYTDPIFVLTV